MSAADHTSKEQMHYSAMRDPDARTGGKWRGWVGELREGGQSGRRITHDGNGFVHPTKAAAVKAIKAQHPPKKMT